MLEAVGALAAVSAGAWLGALYLEVDLREAWNLAAGKAGFTQFEIEIDEAEAESADEKAEPLDDKEGQQLQQEVLEKVDAADTATNREIEQLRKALERLESSQKAGAESPKIEQGHDEQVAPRSSTTDNVSSKNAVGKRTLAYWNQLNQIMLKEEQLRQAPSDGLTAANTGAFLAARGKASRFAASAMRKLPAKNVDPIVANLARGIADWYEQGAKLNDQAMHLFVKADPATRRGPLGQSWSTAEKQHQNEVKLLNRRGDTVRRQMIIKYGLAFPDLR